MEILESYLPAITLSGLATLLTICGFIWRAVRKLATIDDVRQHVDALRTAAFEETEVLHTRISKLEEEYRAADQTQTEALSQRIDTLDRHLDGRLDSLDRHVSQIVGVLLEKKQ